MKEAKSSNEPVQELLIVMQRIYRKFPHKYNYQNSLKELVDILDSAVEPEAKAAVAWILGEFAEHIPSSIELIMPRIEK